MFSIPPKPEGTTGIVFDNVRVLMFAIRPELSGLFINPPCSMRMKGSHYVILIVLDPLPKRGLNSPSPDLSTLLTKPWRPVQLASESCRNGIHHRR